MSGYTPSLERLIEQFAKLPSVGKKSAQRLAFHMLNMSEQDAKKFTDAIISARESIKKCSICCNLTDGEVCSVCSSQSRDKSTICVVEDPRDVIAIERTHEYNGLYHVLGGIISPMDGIGPADLPIGKLVERVEEGDVQEVILALSTSMEGETTSFFLYKKLSALNIKISTIARGVGFGDDLEYTDELTLGKSIQNRHLFKL